MPNAMLGISILCFTIFQFIPGGPVEQQIISHMRHAGGNHGAAA